MAEHNDLGKWGEQQVVERLILQGYTIMERNWRMGHLEVDIIASRGEDIIFVEVKTRANRLDDPLAAITPRKMRLLCNAAETYIRSLRIPLNPRFDVAAVTVTNSTDPTNPTSPASPTDPSQREAHIEYYPDAISPYLRSY